jgi:hypothetical protein
VFVDLYFDHVLNAEPIRSGRLGAQSADDFVASTVRPAACRSPAGKNAILPSGCIGSSVSRSGLLSTDIFTTSSGPSRNDETSGVKLRLDGVGANSVVVAVGRVL